MTDILDLPDWSVVSQHQEDGVYVIDAEYTVQPNSERVCCSRMGLLAATLIGIVCLVMVCSGLMRWT